MMIEVEQARSAFYSPASAQDEIGDTRALAVHSAKTFSSEIYQFCAGEVIQLHRGIGLTWEHDAASLLQPRGEQCLRARLAALHPEQVARLIRLDAAA